jgi:hypothetical protein
MSEIPLHDTNLQPGSSRLARGVADRLSLAAAPVFASMALLSARYGGSMESLCSAGFDASWPSGMTAMYALMSVFHSPPWLKRLST